MGYRRGDAIQQYDGYKRDGKIVGGIPRYGEPVFYNIAVPYGHTAIYIGGLTIVSAQGMDGNKLSVARRGLHSFPATSVGPTCSRQQAHHQLWSIGTGGGL